MASRQIVIRIVYDNKDAINAAKAQAIAQKSVNDETEKGTHLQNGLTSSFIKGNLAARAISIGFLAVRDSLKFAAGEAVQFEHNMTKIAAITETGGASLRSLEKTIRNLSLATNQNQNEIAKTALEMGKMGLTGPQVEEALGGVARLARALDEDLVKTGETVVSVLNAYGFSTSEAAKITDQLAFTVKASALSIESFGTAFSYVGGTAKAAGVDFLELQGAMDVLSNAGIKASTIGTQLRRIIADLSDPSSKAGRAIAGQTIETLGLVGALQALGEKNIDIAGLTEIFGRTASSVASIAIRYSGVIGDLAKQTGEASGVTQEMSDQMNTTFLSALQGAKTGWADLGIEISKSTGLLKDFANFAKDALGSVVATMNQTRSVADFKKAKPDEFNRIFARDVGVGFKSEESIVGASEEFSIWKAQAAQAEADLKRKENAVSELKALFDKDMKLPANFNPDKQLDMIQIDPENTYMYNYIRKLFGTDDKGFEAALKRAKVEWALKAERVTGEAFDTNTLKDKKKVKKVPDFDPMDVFDRLEDLQPNGDTYAESFMKRKDKKEDKADNRINKENEQYLKGIIRTRDHLFELRKAATEATASFAYMQVAMEGVNTSTQIFSSYLSEGIFSNKENPWQGISDAFGDFAKKMAADLIALTIKLLVFRTVLSVVTGGASGFLGGFGFTSQGGSGLADGLLGMLGGKAQKFATGTDQIVRSPTLFMAGDGGAEHVRVTPRAKMNEGSGGNGGGQTFIIQGDVYDYDKFQRKVKQAQDSNKKAYV